MAKLVPILCRVDIWLLESYDRNFNGGSVVWFPKGPTFAMASISDHPRALYRAHMVRTFYEKWPFFTKSASVGVLLITFM